MHETSITICAPLLYFFCLALNNKANAIAPIIHSVIPNNTTIARYEKLELIVDVTATYASPYDFDQVNLQATFTSPSGNVFVVDGFYYQDFTMTQPNVLTPNGAPDWRIRFSPNQKGGFGVIQLKLLTHKVQLHFHHNNLRVLPLYTRVL